MVNLCSLIFLIVLKIKIYKRIIISTDSTKYEKIVKKFGAEVPFLRPKKYSKNNSEEILFIKDLLRKLKKKENYIPDIIVRLLATSPFQKTKDIDKAIKIVLNGNYDSSVVISKARQHPEKALRITGKNKKYVSTYIKNNPLKVGSSLNRQKFGEAFFRSNVLVCKLKIIEKYNLYLQKKVVLLKYHLQ